jgi:D-3-phosphoglycerate dehydrogenase / 2-oxoglutarate reductase
MAREVVVMLDAGQDDPMTLEREILGAAGYELHATQCPDVASLLAAAQGAAGLMMWPQIWLPRISSEVIGALDGCRAIVTYSVGFDHIDLAAAKARGIGVSNTPDWCVDEVANHVMALLLAANKKLALNDRTLRAGRWDHRVLRPLHRITGQTLGLVGVGRIGAAVAARAQPFGLRVVGFDPFVPAERVAALGAEPLASLDALLEQADYVSLHVPLTPATRHLIGPAQLAHMKRSAYLINAARGPVVDEQALIKALQGSQIAGAALDVYEREPLAPDSPLLALDTVTLTPHCASYSEEGYLERRQKAAEEMVRYLSARPPRTPLT